MSRRTDLSFQGLGEVMPEVERLLDGHVTAGRWTLGQICSHLASALRLTLEAPPGPQEPTRGQKAAALLFFRAGRFPEGLPAPHPALEPGSGSDERAEAEGLRQAIARFLDADGPFPPHPVLGPLSKEQWTRFHCIHAAHHLSFASPAP